jgi:hypothetical protein
MLSIAAIERELGVTARQPLSYSLRYRKFIVAFLTTVVVGLIVPLTVPTLLAWVLWPWDSGPVRSMLDLPAAYWCWAVGCELCLAALCLFLLHRRLRCRNFALSSAANA